MGLQHLCPEILFQICELFCNHCQGWRYVGKPPPETFSLKDSHNSLLALCLVCKSIGYIAQRVLHHQFAFVGTGGGRIAQLCRTISSNPQLARELRWADLTLPIDRTTPKEFVEGWLPETINKLSRHLLYGGEGISGDALLTAIILLQAPNLELLKDDRECLNSAFDLLSHDTVIRDHALPPNLKQLRLGQFGTSYCLPYLTMVDLSWKGLGGFINTFKRLESLSIHCPLASGVDKRLSFESLRALRLGGFYMPLKDLEKLISRIPNLETFGFTRIFYPNYAMPEPATGPEILEILAKRNNTLRRLELHISCTHENVTALKELTNLEELKILVGAVHDSSWEIDKQYFVSIMPPSLRKLHLRVYGTETFEKTSDALMTYISSTYRQSPNDQRLQLVHIDPSQHARASVTRQEDTFQQGCQLWAKNGTLLFDPEWRNYY